MRNLLKDDALFVKIIVVPALDGYLWSCLVIIQTEHVLL